MVKIQFLLLTVTCFLGGVVSVTDREFQDLSDRVQHLTKLFQKQQFEENNADDTIAFYCVLTNYTQLSEETTLMFDEVLLNAGNGYNSTTGMFTVPSGGDGYYYFSLNLRVKSGIGSDFDIRIGNDVLCSTFTDLSDSTDADSVMASCSGTASVSAGDVVRVVYTLSASETPLWESPDFYYNGFTGFRF